MLLIIIGFHVEDGICSRVTEVITLIQGGIGGDTTGSTGGAGNTTGDTSGGGAVDWQLSSSWDDFTGGRVPRVARSFCASTGWRSR